MQKISKFLINTYKIRCFSTTSDYQAKCFQFEENWKAISDEKNSELTKNLEKELSEDQKNYITALSKAYLNLNIYEVTYYYEMLKERLLKTKCPSLLSLHMDWPSVKKMEDGRYPVADATWFMQQEKLAEMWPGGIKEFAALFQNMKGSGGDGAGAGGTGSSGNAGGAAEKAAEETSKVEEKAEKTSFEIELTAFDAAQKIKIIKEVRQIFNLGLKDAKDLVEKAPVSLKKDVKKEDADAIVEKLTACGCQLVLK